MSKSVTWYNIPNSIHVVIIRMGDQTSYVVMKRVCRYLYRMMNSREYNAVTSPDTFTVQLKSTTTLLTSYCESLDDAKKTKMDNKDILVSEEPQSLSSFSQLSSLAPPMPLSPLTLAPLTISTPLSQLREYIGNCKVAPRRNIVILCDNVRSFFDPLSHGHTNKADATRLSIVLKVLLYLLRQIDGRNIDALKIKLHGQPWLARVVCCDMFLNSNSLLGKSVFNHLKELELGDYLLDHAAVLPASLQRLIIQAVRTIPTNDITTSHQVITSSKLWSCLKHIRHLEHLDLTWFGAIDEMGECDQYDDMTEDSSSGHDDDSSGVISYYDWCMMVQSWPNLSHLRLSRYHFDFNDAPAGDPLSPFPSLHTLEVHDIILLDRRPELFIYYVIKAHTKTLERLAMHKICTSDNSKAIELTITTLVGAFRELRELHLGTSCDIDGNVDLPFYSTAPTFTPLLPLLTTVRRIPIAPTQFEGDEQEERDEFKEAQSLEAINLCKTLYGWSKLVLLRLDVLSLPNATVFPRKKILQ